ncbi:MAG: 50S ribosomal protein L6 [Pseudomonadota bacterium]|nr:50S ribosomal protein L6 [Pseudomonadota bacterium]
MSRVAKQPIELPSGVQVAINGQQISVKSGQNELSRELHSSVHIREQDNVLHVEPVDESPQNRALAGTSRALVNNMVTGVSKGFERSLDLVGVGYRAQVKGTTLNLTLGFSHPVDVDIPAELTVETPSQTQIVVKGIDKQRVGQFAAEVRALRPPEPYKGKGVRYSDERVIRKEAKKK